MLQNLATLEESILLGIQSNLRNEWLTPVFIFITRLGNGGFIWILGSILLLVPKKTRKIGVMALVALAGSVLIDNVILKNVVARTRPYEVIGGLTSLIGIQKDFSFPSGHTCASFACALVLYRILPKKYGVPAVILASLIAFSRLYVGVHYPTDVLGGMFVGIFSSCLVLWIGKKRTKK